MKNKVLYWLVQILMLDKIVHLFGEIWPAFLKPSVWLRTLGCIPPVAAFLAWRRRQSSLVRHLIGNMLVGLVIAVSLWSLHGFSWLHEIEDSGIDWVIKMQWGVQPTQSALPFALIDIDEETYRDWGEPFHVPRDRLLQLIKYAVEGGALMVVVDVDLSQRGHDNDADKQLKAYLASYDKAGGPPIILTRVFRGPLKNEATPHRSVRRSFLEKDERIAQSRLIHWGSPLFNLDQDRMIRRWRLWELVCAEGQSEIVASIQLLTMALLKPDLNEVGHASIEMQQFLAPLVPGRCGGGNHAGEAHVSNHSGFSAIKLPSDSNTIAQRIIYTQPWHLGPEQSRPKIPVVHGSEAEVPVLSIRSALPIFKPSADSSWLSGRVVVIGASFSESRDRYLTPLGEMPGALVLINAIHSLQQYGELTGPQWYVMLLVEALLIVVMSLAFAWFNSFWGMVVSGTFIILWLLPLSFVVFRYGVWLDFAIPLVAVQLHQLYEGFHEPQHRHSEEPGHAAVTAIRSYGKNRVHRNKHSK